MIVTGKAKVVKRRVDVDKERKAKEREKRFVQEIRERVKVIRRKDAGEREIRNGSCGLGAKSCSRHAVFDAMMTFRGGGWRVMKRTRGEGSSRSGLGWGGEGVDEGAHFG